MYTGEVNLNVCRQSELLVRLKLDQAVLFGVKSRPMPGFYA